MSTKDRFTKIATNYEALFEEVFEIQGLDYRVLENSIFEHVVLNIPEFRHAPILDVGVGDGASSRKFIEAGCTNITGIDLNSTMIEQAQAKYGDKIRLVLGDAAHMEMFGTEDFLIVVAAFAIHNIAKTERSKFWAEILRLSPQLLVMAEKIADADPVTHRVKYDSEVHAVDVVYRQRHGLEEAAKEWRAHYEWDEKEKLEMEEIVQSLGDNYDIDVVFEMGMCKTVVCKRKK
jgi:ubiquinone/menaquinone biosynthesis C-methylase UbiE